MCHLSVQPMLSSSSDKNSGGRVVRGQKTGGQRPRVAKLSRKQGKEVYFSRQVEPTAAQKAVTPPVSNYGCDSDKPAT